MPKKAKSLGTEPEVDKELGSSSLAKLWPSFNLWAFAHVVSASQKTFPSALLG